MCVLHYINVHMTQPRWLWHGQTAQHFAVEWLAILAKTKLKPGWRIPHASCLKYFKWNLLLIQI
jgi:hypothetical protein